MVQEVNCQEDLDKIVKKAKGKVVALDFYATWCNPCKMIAPKFEEFADKYKNVICVKVDADQAEELLEKYNVQAMPTFLFLKEENDEVVEVHRMMGADSSKLEECICKYNGN